MGVIYAIVGLVATVIVGTFAAELVVPAVMFAVTALAYGAIGCAISIAIRGLTRRTDPPVPVAREHIP